MKKELKQKIAKYHKLQTEWSKEFTKGFSENKRDRFVCVKESKMPLKIIPIISTEDYKNSVDYDNLKKYIVKNKIHRGSSSIDLFDGCVEMRRNSDICWDDNDTKTRGWKIFYDEYNDILWRGDFEKISLDVWTDYIIKD